jgi:hypothetical protein
MKWGCTASLVALAVTSTQASWWNLMTEDFDSSASNRWHYAGVSNALNQALFQINPTSGVVEAEWDQGNSFSGGDPYTIKNSALSRPLPRLLRDTDTFRIGATLRLAAGSIPDTSEFWQLANLGLYNLAAMGPDRTLADDYSGNTTLLRNGSDFVEFNYWINNAATVWGDFAPNIGAVAGGHVTNDIDMLYTTGDYGDASFFHNTDMGLGHYLPVDTDLFIELTYHGATTGNLSRRVYAAVYTDAARTSLLEVNGAPMYYWTQPVPAVHAFTLTEAAFFNYASANWGGANGRGAGTWDSLYVDLAVGAGGVAEMSGSGAGPTMTWAAEPGVDYALLVSSDLASGVWSTQQVVSATGTFMTVEIPAGSPVSMLRVEALSSP